MWPVCYTSFIDCIDDESNNTQEYKVTNDGEKSIWMLPEINNIVTKYSAMEMYVWVLFLTVILWYIYKFKQIELK